MYYLRSRPATNAIKFTVDVEALLKESCEGFELKHFNSTIAKDGAAKEGLVLASTIVDEKENININLQQEQLSKEVTKLQEEKLGEKKQQPLAACPLRKKKKNSNGDLVEEDGECEACGS